MRKPFVFVFILILAVLILAACRPSPKLDPTPDRLLADPDSGLDLSCRNGVVRVICLTDPPVLAETLIPTLTETLTPTPIDTRAPTDTPTPTITPAVLAGACPPHESGWHEPEDEPCRRHHHGVNPREYADVFSMDGFDLDQYLDDYGELRQVWETSPGEEWNGYIWLYEHIPDCEQYAPESDPGMWDDWDCITDALIRIHDTGTADHFIKRFHSETFIIKGCAKNAEGLPDFENCGVIATGDHHDYGVMHTPYKKVHCPVLEADPPGFYELDQPPYRAHTIVDPLKPNPDLVVQFWSGQAPNPINNPNNMYYPHGPNALVGFGWSSVDAWQLFDPSICDRTYLEMAALASQLPVVDGMQHVTFQIFNLNILEHPAGLFVGWTDQNGHVWPDGVCETASPSCIPLIITEGFPERRLILQRRVDQGNCDFAPCLVIDTGGVPMLFPGEDVP